MRAKPTQQQRSEAKRDRILEAMDALLIRMPFEQISVAVLSREAEVSPATVYQRFSNTDATASVLLELYYLKVEERAQRKIQGLNHESTLFEALRLIAEDAYEQINDLGYIMRPAYLYSRHHPNRVGDDWSRLESIALKGFQEFVQSRSSEIRIDELNEAAAYLCYFFNFMMTGLMLHREDSAQNLLHDRNLLTDSVANMAYQYLVNPPGLSDQS